MKKAKGSSQQLSLPLQEETISAAKPWNPEPWRLLGVSFLLEHACGGLLLDPGLGKTSMTLAAIKVLKKEKLLRRALIIPPRRPMYMVWPAEIKKWLDFAELSAVILHGKDKEKRLHEDHDIYLMNPEGLPWLMQEKRFQILSPDTLVIDELSKFKHTNTQRFKMLKPVLGYFKRRWGLTGSPNPNGYEDLFGQMYVLDLGNALGRYITHYRNQYFHPTGYGGYTWVLNKGADKQIQQKLKPLVLRMDADDYIQLPEAIENIIRVYLPEQARKVYEDMEDDMLVRFQYMEQAEEVITAVNAAACSQKCCQIANGGLYSENMFDGKPRTWKLIHDAKTEALVDLIDELQGTPLLVGYEFDHDLERILKALGKDTPYIGGGVSDKKAMEIEAKWNRGEIPVLLGQPQSIGHGLNMQFAGNNVCWYSTPWDYEVYDQFIRRVRRSGNKHGRVFIHHIIARDTVDEAKLAAVRRKARDQKKFLDAINQYRKGIKRQLPIITKREFSKMEPVNDADIPF